MNPLLFPGLLGTASVFVGMQVWHSGRARALLRQLGVRAAHAHEGRGKPLRPVGIVPAPVARYLDLALGSCVPAPRLAILEQIGMLRTDTRSLRWWPFQATHTASPLCPDFLWNARVKLAPGLHLRVMDFLVEGIGAGEVLLLSALRLGHERGRSEMNAGALHRYLAEAPWYPWALLPGERLTWSGIDDSRAMATLVDGATTVSLEFRFAASGEVSGIYSPGRWGRFSDGFRQVPWKGRFEAYERHAGVLVPTQAAVGWYRGASLELVWQGQVHSLRLVE